MAKTYIDIVKYMVEAKFEISGLVDKPDIIGAVFGQTEGLLGSDLDLRELQKNGKIGRIEINAANQGGRTIGKLFLPSSLGKVETCILAAAVESVDRVGPFETEFKIEKVEDTRNEKRSRIVKRAKELVKQLLTTGLPDSRELSDMVETEVKSSAVVLYGPEQLPAGPDVDASEEVILVEGRADVITLLKNDVTNCVSVGGAAGTVPKSVVDLCNKKDIVVFLDGDRGGDMILKGIMNVAEIDFVARAPDGKEVEELTRKEIIKALRSRVPIDQVFPSKGSRQHGSRMDERERPQGPSQAIEVQRQHSVPAPQRQRPYEPAQVETRPSVPSPSDIATNLTARPQRGSRVELNIKTIGEELEGIDAHEHKDKPRATSPVAGPDQKLLAALEELHNTLRGRLYDREGTLITEVPIRELIQVVQDTKNINAIVFDGIITQRLVELANRSSVKQIYGIRSSQVTKTYDDMYLYTKEHS